MRDAGCCVVPGCPGVGRVTSGAGDQQLFCTREKSSAKIKLILSHKMYYSLLSYRFFRTLKLECEQLKIFVFRETLSQSREKGRICGFW